MTETVVKPTRRDGSSTSALSSAEIDALKKYLAKGGKLLMELDPPDKADSPPLTNLIALDPRVVIRELHRAGWQSRLYEITGGAEPVRAEMNPPAWTIRSSAPRSTR